MQKFGSKFGMHFVPDNHVVPVMRWSRFHRWAEAGYHAVWPIAEALLPSISLGTRIGRFRFKDVTSRDNIAFTIQMVVCFRFDPRTAEPHVQSALVQLTAQVLLDAVADRAEQALRRKVSRYRAEELAGQPAVMQMEQDIGHYLQVTLRPLGIAVPKDAIIIKEIVAPEKFQQAMILVRQHRIFMRAFREHRDTTVVDQALWADFLNKIEPKDGNITIFQPPEPNVVSTLGPYWNHINGVKKRREH